jgi:hypothetical protein
MFLQRSLRVLLLVDHLEILHDHRLDHLLDLLLGQTSVEVVLRFTGLAEWFRGFEQSRWMYRLAGEVVQRIIEDSNCCDTSCFA